MKKPIDLKLDLINKNIFAAINVLLLDIEDAWFIYEREIYCLKNKDLYEAEGYPISNILRFDKTRNNLIKYWEMIDNQMDIQIHDLFLIMDGGGDNEIIDNGCADSMREQVWRDALRKGRLTEEEKTLMPYEPWEAVVVPPDYYGRLHKYLITLVGWDKSERDPEIVKLIYA